MMLAAALASCAGPPAPGPQHRARGVAVLEKHCSACHVPDSPIAVQSALVVFDLSESDFSARMSDAQLEESALMLDEMAAATDEERAAFRAFLDEELAWRSAHPSLYPKALRERGLNRKR